MRVKLKHIDNWVSRRIACAKIYAELLKGISGLSLLETSEFAKHAYNYYTLRIKKSRSAAQEGLKQNNIASAIYYPLCLHLQQVYQELGYKRSDFPVAERAQEEVLSLPIYPELTEDGIRLVVESLRQSL